MVFKFAFDKEIFLLYLYAGLTVARQRQTVLCLLQARLANRGMILFSGRLSIHSSVIKLVNMIFWKRMNRFCCKLVWVVHPPGAWNDQFSGQEVKGQRSRFYTRPLLGMLTSLDWHESENFFSRLRIKFLEVEYREMTLGHTQCAWKTRSVWLPDHGWAPRERWRQLPLKSCVVGGLHRHCL